MTNKLLKKCIDKLIKESASQEVVQAFKNTPEDYMTRTLGQRNAGANSAGSTFSSPQTIESLLAVDWKPYNHPNLDTSEGAHGYVGDVPGVVKAVSIDSVPTDFPVMIQPAHGGVGRSQAGVPLAECVGVLPGAGSVDYTTLIVGPASDTDTTEMVWTFYPGDPTKRGIEIPLAQIQEDFKGKSIVPMTAGEAMAYGFDTVKHVEKMPKEEITQQESKRHLKKLIEGPVISMKTRKEISPRLDQIKSTIMDIHMEYEDRLLDVMRDSKFIDEVVDELKVSVPSIFQNDARAKITLRVHMLEALTAFFEDVRNGVADVEED